MSSPRAPEPDYWTPRVSAPQANEQGIVTYRLARARGGRARARRLTPPGGSRWTPT